MLQKYNSPENVYAFHLKGKITGEEIEAIKKSIDPMLKAKGGIGLVMDLTELSDATSGAIEKDLERELGMLGDIQKFKRVAIMTDKDWPTALVKVGNRILPRGEFKTFRSDEKEIAIKWSSEFSEAESQTTQGIKFLETTDKSVFAAEVDGRIAEEDVVELAQRLTKMSDLKSDIKFLVNFKNVSGVEFSAFFNKELFAANAKLATKSGQYAVVGGPVWMRRVVDVLNPLLPKFKMRTFEPGQEVEAWKWLATQPVSTKH